MFYKLYPKLTNILSLMLLFFHLANQVSGDVHIADSVIAAVAGPGAHIGTASVVSQLHPPNKNEGVFSDNSMYYLSGQRDGGREGIKSLREEGWRRRNKEEKG